MSCDYAVRVTMDVTPSGGRGKRRRTGPRSFIVEYNADGEVLRIKEIRKLEGPYVVGVYHQPYFRAGTHALRGLPVEIIAAANAKIRAEQLGADATP